MSPENLDELVRRAVEGDGSALASLTQQLETPVFSLCLRMLGDVHDAEDATQDVLVKVVTHLSSFEGRSAITTWVHRIAVRHVLSLERGRAEQRALDEEGFAALLDRGLEYAGTQPAPSPEDLALISEVRLSCTQGMLLMLSREERLALVLADLLGFNSAEAADIAEVSHDAFRQRLSRARSRLSAFLEERCGLASSTASCRCERQVSGKVALGLSAGNQKLTPLSRGDLSVTEDTRLALSELKSVRKIASAFHRGGAYAAPETLHARMKQLLPTVLQG
jgi:RNA polymerase sigma factor (sigma-70 family)